jgi:hypothetical protein
MVGLSAIYVWFTIYGYQHISFCWWTPSSQWKDLFYYSWYNCGPHAQITLCNILVDGYRNITYRASCFMALLIKSEYFSSQYSLWFEICSSWFYVLDFIFSFVSILSFMLCGRKLYNLCIVMMPKSIIENITNFN